ncbi:MAG TPA: NAD(P)-dependent oxidoreductase [Lacipirellula sp.]
MNIAWIGTGVMGTSMCRRLIEAGHTAVVHNRTRSKADPLVELGAAWAAKPQAAAAQADVVFTMVGHPSDVREVILGQAGALAGCREGAILVDMTTSQPALALEIAREAEQRGVVALDAPVSGGDVGARSGTLSIMIGGDVAAVEKLQSLWQTMGKTIVRHGGPGAGQHAKMANQVLVGAGMIGICEALLYAHRAGLDLNKMIESTASGAAGSWALSNLAPRIIRGDFAPGFYVEHFLKDLGIILEECRRMNLKLPGVELAERLYRETAAIGHNRSGTQALIFALAQLNGEDWRSC